MNERNVSVLKFQASYSRFPLKKKKRLRFSIVLSILFVNISFKQPPMSKDDGF